MIEQAHLPQPSQNSLVTICFKEWCMEAVEWVETEIVERFARLPYLRMTTIAQIPQRSARLSLRSGCCIAAMGRSRG